MKELILAALKALMPPGVGADETAQYRWRIAVAGVCGLTFVAVIGVAVVAFGLGIGSGFAWASDTTAARIDDARDKAFDYHEKACIAWLDSQRQAQLAYDRQVNEKLAIIETLGGKPPPLTPCEAFRGRHEP